jgi:chromosome segregation and condensation protein ScpB
MTVFQFTDEALDEMRVALSAALDKARHTLQLNECRGSASERKLALIIQKTIAQIDVEKDFRAAVRKIIEKTRRKEVSMRKTFRGKDEADE